MGRLALWGGLNGWRAEVASVDLTARGVVATGTQLGADPVAYRLDYQLDASEDFVTRSLRAEAAGEDWSRRLDLTHDGDGVWRCDVEEEGVVELPPAGGDLDAVRGALDCDLAFSPLTNLMPVRRHGMLERRGEIDFLMAWVSVPDLGVHPSRQRYEHVRRDADGAVVRYVGRDGSFVSELVFDTEGIVRLYPQLARRIEPGIATA
ncbi:MAG: putative glycolipid-binding domain-containing protein [Actinomycetota bacterium]|nr:putative glycolipid-binding domain-containing protein [Actinomycetota bacterium]